MAFAATSHQRNFFSFLVCFPFTSFLFLFASKLGTVRVGQRESVSVKFVETALQTSDVLTKPVTRGIFERHSRRLLGEKWLFDGEADLATDLHAGT